MLEIKKRFSTLMVKILISIGIEQSLLKMRKKRSSVLKGHLKLTSYQWTLSMSSNSTMTGLAKSRQQAASLIGFLLMK
jgi:hypothetical protein